ncbi:hypothetical protein ACFQ07_01825 [Actinomadura adrarensis]|uniref:Uncharacterized protein n=1 Tax=Actinomadura adrarensis TaxID=1819600 RepID=A0ABW3CAK6_9ACTN
MYEFEAWQLTWDEVDPRRIPFDSGEAAGVLAGLEMPAPRS